MNSLILKLLPESERPWAKAFLAIEDEGSQARRLEWLLSTWIVLHVVLMWADHPGWLFAWILIYTLSQAGAFTREVSNGSQEWLFSLPPNRATIAKIRLWRFFAPLLAVTVLSTISLAIEAPRHLWGLVFDGPFTAPWASYELGWLVLPVLGLAAVGYLVAWLLRSPHPQHLLPRWIASCGFTFIVILIIMALGISHTLVISLISLLLLMIAGLCLYFSAAKYPQIEAQVPLLEGQARSIMPRWVWVLIGLIIGLVLFLLLYSSSPEQQAPQRSRPVAKVKSYPEVKP
ncbi:MAG: hypothetical protein RL095_1721 [Verrucomicrobiota bacterium]|jgi:hypothetical protein